MSKYYSAEFKMEAVKQVRKTGEHVARIAAELGVNENNLYGWGKRSRENILFFVEAKKRSEVASSRKRMSTAYPPEKSKN